jgi:hypothetical protein
VEAGDLVASFQVREVSVDLLLRRVRYRVDGPTPTRDAGGRHERTGTGRMVEGANG